VGRQSLEDQAVVFVTILYNFGASAVLSADLNM
jgi:hypothetical protein